MKAFAIEGLRIVVPNENTVEASVGEDVDPDCWGRFVVEYFEEYLDHFDTLEEAQADVATRAGRGVEDLEWTESQDGRGIPCWDPQ